MIAADRAIARLIDRLQAAAADELPGVAAERISGGLRLSGRGLMRRWIGDPVLRGFAVVAARRER